jgi:hypothetical protein
MIVWLVCEKKTEGPLVPIGIFEDTQTAVSKISEGTYVGIPITVNRLHTSTIVDEGMPGSKTHVAKATELNETLESVRAAFYSLDSFVRDTVVPSIQTELADIKDRLDVLEAP